MGYGRFEERISPSASPPSGIRYPIIRYKHCDIASAPVSPTRHRRPSCCLDSRHSSDQRSCRSLPQKLYDRHAYSEPVRRRSSEHKDWEKIIEREKCQLARKSVSRYDVVNTREPSHSRPSGGNWHASYRSLPAPVASRHISRPHPSIDGEELLNILVVGGTGVGKSELISQLADHSRSRATARVGHSLMSCTADVTAFPCICDGIRFNLIDSPGFDDTRYSDGEVLAKFAQFFRQRSAPAIHGVIFMHRISDTRLSGSAVQTAQIIKNMCGRDFTDRIVLVTTMWDRVKDRRVAERREDELLNHPRFWRDLYNDDDDRSYQFSLGGSDGGRKSAQNIVRFFLDQRRELLSKPVSLQLAEETQRGRLLDSTAAGASILGRHGTTHYPSAPNSVRDRHSYSPEQRYSTPGVKVR